MVEREGRTGFSALDADDLARFRPIEGLASPDGSAYVITDVETGKDTLNVRPNDAIGMIESRGRSPLTVDEGIAFVTQYLEAVAEWRLLPWARVACKRVTALWISKRTPKLGWCFAGVPHTWLRPASCAGRVGAPEH